MKLNEVAGSVEAFRESFPHSGLDDSIVRVLVDAVKAKGMGELEVGEAILGQMRTTALNKNANWRLSGPTSEEEAARAWTIFLDTTKRGPEARFRFEVPAAVEVPFRVEYDDKGRLLRY